MNATRLVMIRHAESAAVAGRWISGEATCRGITDRGRAQAQALHRRLLEDQGLAPDIVISSSMRRAKETTLLITPQLSEGFVLDDELVERRPGECEGMTYVEYEESYGCAPWSDWQSPLSPGGESDADFVTRVRAAVTRIVDAHRGQLIWVVCHGGVLMATAHWLMQTPTDGPHWENPAFTSLSEWHASPPATDSDRWTLSRYNDHAHLVGLA
jgi:probable phosphoglycerate mutase